MTPARVREQAAVSCQRRSELHTFADQNYTLGGRPAPGEGAGDNAIAREALRLGIDALERDPSHVLRKDHEELK